MRPDDPTRRLALRFALGGAFPSLGVMAELMKNDPQLSDSATAAHDLERLLRLREQTIRERETVTREREAEIERLCGLIAQKDQEIKAIQSTLAEREQAIVERETANREREAEIARLSEIVARREDEITALQALLFERERTLRQFEAHAGQTQAQPDQPQSEAETVPVNIMSLVDPAGALREGGLDSLLKILDRVDGWCTANKAAKLYELASSPDCGLAVEIGIFGGKSLLPVAAAFARKGAGVIYGVEPWENAVAVETATNDVNDDWWRKIDLVAIKRNFFGHVQRLQLEKHVRVLEIPSDAAIPVFQSARYADKIDLVHVDGAHSVEQSVFDCAYWLKLLRSGGHLVLDDINWPSVALAHEFLKSTAILTYSVSNDAEGHFSIFRKP